MSVARRKNGSPLVVASKLNGVLVDNVIKANDPNVDFFQVEVDTTLPGGTASNQYGVRNQFSTGVTLDVGWGDSTFNETTGGDITHTYSTGGAYSVRCIGQQLHRNQGPADVPKITQINRFGRYNRCRFSYASFQGASIDGPLLVTDTMNPDENDGSEFNNLFTSSGITTWPANAVLDFAFGNSSDRMFFGNSNFNGNVGVITGTFTTLKELFDGCSSFNNGGSSDINNLTLNLTGTTNNGFEAFRDCTVFNQPLDNWDTTGIDSCGGMFWNAAAFNQDLGNWNMSSVTSMATMFRESGFNNGGVGGVGLGIDQWDVSNVTTLGFGFYLSDFNQYIGSWDTSSFTNFNNCWRGTPFDSGGIGDLNSWNMSKVTIITSIFQDCVTFNRDIGSWNFGGSDSTGTTTSVVVNKLVDSTANFTGDGITTQHKVRNETTGDVANVTSVAATELSLSADIFTVVGNSYSVFRTVALNAALLNCRAFNHDIGSWNMENVSNMTRFLEGTDVFNNGGVTGSGTGVDNWRFKYPMSMNSAFQNAPSFNCAINNWTTEKVTDFAECFYHATSFDQPINNINFSNCTSISAMFRQTALNQPITGGTGWDGTMGKVESASFFLGQSDMAQPITLSMPVCTNFFGGLFATPLGTNAVQIEFSSTVGFAINSMFAQSSFNNSVDTSGIYWNMEKCTSATNSFSPCNNYNQACPNWSLKSMTNMTNCFSNTNISAANIASTIEGWEANIPATGVNASGVFGNKVVSESTYPNAKTAYDRLLAAVNVKSSGTNTSIATNKLIDTGADFITDAVAIGDYVTNTTSGEQAKVTAIDSATQLSLNSDIFKGTPANYEVAYGYGWNLTNAINWTP